MSEDLKPGTGAVDSPLHPAAPHNVSETATSDPTGRLAGGVAPAVNMPDGAMSTAAPGEAPEPLLQAEAGHPIVEDDAGEHPAVDERKDDADRAN